VVFGDCGRWIVMPVILGMESNYFNVLLEDRRERVLNGHLPVCAGERIVPEPESTTKLFEQILHQYPQWNREITLASGEALIAYRQNQLLRRLHHEQFCGSTEMPMSGVDGGINVHVQKSGRSEEAGDSARTWP